MKYPAQKYPRLLGLVFTLTLGGALVGCSLFQTPSAIHETTAGLTSETDRPTEASNVPSPTPFQPGEPTPAKKERIPASSPSPTFTPTLPPSVCPGGSCLATSAPTPVEVATSGPFEGQGIPIPIPAIRIVQPGQLSKIASPINIEAQVILGESGVIQIELLGEDGRFISREVIPYGLYNGQRIYINKRIDFELPGTSEAARLQILTEDNSGRTVSMSSVDLVLLKYGESDITSAASVQEPLVIAQPFSGQVFTGGKVKVSGVVNLGNEAPLYLDLIDYQDTIIGSRQVMPNSPGSDGYCSFQVEIPYRVEKSLWARLSIHQPGSRLPGDSIVRSVMVYVNP